MKLMAKQKYGESVANRNGENEEISLRNEIMQCKKYEAEIKWEEMKMKIEEINNEWSNGIKETNKREKNSNNENM